MSSFSSPALYLAAVLPDRGTSLLATTAIPRDSVILSHRPEVTVLYSPFVQSHCSSCYASLPPSSYSCAECRSFSLCPSCSSPPSISWHLEGECSSFRKVPAPLRQGDSDYLRWFLRYFDVRCRGPPPLSLSFLSASASSSAPPLLLSPCPFSSLVHLAALQPPSQLEWSAGFAQLFAEHCSPPIPAAEIETLLLKIRLNTLGYPFTAEQTLGWSLSSVACLLNHSCAPNSFARCGASGVLEVVAIRDVKEGEELTISYVDLISDDMLQGDKRREALRDKYLFECKCERCEEEGGE